MYFRISIYVFPGKERMKLLIFILRFLLKRIFERSNKKKHKNERQQQMRNKIINVSKGEIL